MIGRCSDVKGPSMLASTGPSASSGNSSRVTFMITDKANKIELSETCKLNTFKYQGEPTILGNFFC